MKRARPPSPALRERLSMTLVKSPGFLCRLTYPLSSNVGQVVVFIVRFMVSPHHKNNLKPLCSQSPKRLRVAMSFSPLVSIVRVRPLTSIERDKGQPVGGVAQQFVTGKTKLDCTVLATRLGDRNRSRFGLQVAKGFPPTLGVPQFSPEHRHDRATFSSRQCLDKFSRRHRGEKTFDLFAVTVHGLNQSLELDDQHQKQLRLDSNHVLGNLKLWLAQSLPQLLTAFLTETVLALGKAVPLPAGKLRQSPRSWVLLEKIQRYFGFQIRKILQSARVILFELHLDLIDKPSFMAHQPVVVAGEQFKLLSRLGTRLQSPQVSMIGPQKLRQHISIKGIALGLAHPKPIPGPVQSLGINRIDHHPAVQQKIHHAPVRLLDSRPKLDPFGLTLTKPTTQLAQPLRTLLYG